MDRREFAAGQYIFGEGEASDVAYMIESGAVDVVKATADGEVVLAVLREGDIFGEMGVIDEAPRSAAARAREPLIAAAIDRDEFVHLIFHDRERGIAILRALFERLRSTNQMLLQSEEGDDIGPGAGRGVRVRILPTTPETRASLPHGGIEVTRYPLRIGRKAQSVEAGVLSFNELELRDWQPFQISLNHLAVDIKDSRPFVRDRGSRHGTAVNGGRIGGDALRVVAPLLDGDNEVVLGLPESPYRLNIVVAS